MTFFVDEELSSTLDPVISHLFVDKGLSISERRHPTRSTRSSALVDVVIRTLAVNERRDPDHHVNAHLSRVLVTPFSRLYDVRFRRKSLWKFFASYVPHDYFFQLPWAR